MNKLELVSGRSLLAILGTVNKTTNLCLHLLILLGLLRFQIIIIIITKTSIFTGLEREGENLKRENGIGEEPGELRGHSIAFAGLDCVASGFFDPPFFLFLFWIFLVLILLDLHSFFLISRNFSIFFNKRWAKEPHFVRILVLTEKVCIFMHFNYLYPVTLKISFSTYFCCFDRIKEMLRFWKFVFFW